MPFFSPVNVQSIFVHVYRCARYNYAQCFRELRIAHSLPDHHVMQSEHAIISIRSSVRRRTARYYAQLSFGFNCNLPFFRQLGSSALNLSSAGPCHRAAHLAPKRGLLDLSQSLFTLSVCTCTRNYQTTQLSLARADDTITI